MKKPYYELSEKQKTAIIMLLESCRKTNVWNFSFQDYEEKSNNIITFYISECRDYHRLIVKTDIKRSIRSKRDIYKIHDTNCIEYDYSEKDD